MSNDSENGNKFWKKVVPLLHYVLYFVALIAILVSVLIPLLIPFLILSVELWKPELFEPYKEFTKYKQCVIGIIILLVGVGLLSFLLQKYMKTDPEKADKTQDVSPSWVHLTLRLATWFLSIVILTAVLIPFFTLTLSVESWTPELWEFLRKSIESEKNSELLGRLDNLKEFIENKQRIIAIITLVSGVGLLSFLLGKNIESIQNSLSNIKKENIEIFKILGTTRLPKTKKKESLPETYRSVAKVWPFMRKTFTESGKLILNVLILCIIFLSGYVSAKTVFLEKLDGIKKDIEGLSYNLSNEIESQRRYRIEQRTFNYISRVKIDTLQVKITAISDTTEVAGLQISVDSLQISVDSLHASVDSLQISVDSLHASVDSFQISVDSLHTSVDSLQISVDNLHTSVDNLHTSADSLKADAVYVYFGIEDTLKKKEYLKTSGFFIFKNYKIINFPDIDSKGVKKVVIGDTIRVQDNLAALCDYKGRLRKGIEYALIKPDKSSDKPQTLIVFSRSLIAGQRILAVIKNKDSS